MIAFRYTKCDGAEYLSHLDLLRHIYRTLRRAGADIKFSEGFHKHPKIYLNNPLPIGIKSVAEYGAVDCTVEGEFDHIFNTFSPKGVKCTAYKTVDENPNFAYAIDSCRYFARGVKCDEKDFLSRGKVIMTDLKGREIDLRERVVSVECGDGGVYFTAKNGTNNLRADLFCSFLSAEYGGKAEEIIKVAAFGNPVF